MKKNLNNRNGVFSSITGNNGEVNKIQEFITDTKNMKNQSDELVIFTELYEKKIGKLERELDSLSDIEEIILQMRTKEDTHHIRLSQVKDYVYARAPFYRHDKKVKDIRVIVERMDNIKLPFNKLQTNKKFMELAKQKLNEAMDLIIIENIKSFKKNLR